MCFSFQISLSSSFLLSSLLLILSNTYSYSQKARKVEKEKNGGSRGDDYSGSDWRRKRGRRVRGVGGVVNLKGYPARDMMCEK